MDHYDAHDGLLVVNKHLVSTHLVWVLKNAIYEFLPRETFKVLAFYTDRPTARNEEGVETEIWGCAFPLTGVIAINLGRIFDQAQEDITSDKGMFTAIRTSIIVDTIITGLHEAKHIQGMDEALCTEASERLAWEVGAKWDVDVEDLGPYLEERLSTLIAELRTDLDEGGVIADWVKCQLHAHTHELGYYNPLKQIEIASVRDCFNMVADTDNTWSYDGFNHFNKSRFEEVDEVNHNKPLAEVPEALPEALPVSNQGNCSPALARRAAEEMVEEQPPTPVMPEPKAAAVEPPAPPSVPAATTNTMVAPMQADDEGAEDVYSFDDEDDDIPLFIPPPMDSPEMAPPPDVETAAPATTGLATPIGANTTTAINTTTAPKQSSGFEQVSATVGKVLTKLHQHVFEKCELNKSGTFNNPGGTVDPVEISNIEGAEDIFVHYLSTDATNTWTAGIPCNGVIRGCISESNMPQYKLGIRIGGVVQVYTFIAHNVLKNPIGKWSIAVKEKQVKIMFLLSPEGTDGGILMDVKREAHRQPGMEAVSLWSKK